MIKKITIILAAAICLVLAANLFAQADEDQPKADPQREQIRRPQLRDSQERPLRQREGLPPIVQQQPRRLESAREPVPQRQEQMQNQPVRPLAQAFDRWFEAVKKAYREKDAEKLGNLIRRMEQLRNQAPLAERPGQAQLRAGGAQQQRRLRQQGLRQQGLRQQGKIGPMRQGRGFGQQQRWLQPQGNFRPQGPVEPMGQGSGFGQWPGSLGPENFPQITGPQREQFRQQRRLQRQNRQAPPDTPQTEEEFDWDW